MEDITYLAHFGIKGQRWGVRRYQNEDGTLTPEGRKRYGELTSRLDSGNFSNKDVSEYLSLRKVKTKSDRIEKRRARTADIQKKFNDFRDRNTSDTMKKARREDINKLSNEELRQYNERLNLERNYQQLTKRNDAISAGENWMSKQGNQIATQVLVTGIAIPVATVAVKKALGLK